MESQDRAVRHNSTLRCVACSKPAKRIMLFTPALCEELQITPRADQICLNCYADISMEGQWTGDGWQWLQEERSITLNVNHSHTTL